MLVDKSYYNLKEDLSLQVKKLEKSLISVQNEISNLYFRLKDISKCVDFLNGYLDGLSIISRDLLLKVELESSNTNLRVQKGG